MIFACTEQVRELCGTTSAIEMDTFLKAARARAAKWDPPIVGKPIVPPERSPYFSSIAPRAEGTAASPTTTPEAPQKGQAANLNNTVVEGETGGLIVNPDMGLPGMFLPGLQGVGVGATPVSTLAAAATSVPQGDSGVGAADRGEGVGLVQEGGGKRKGNQVVSQKAGAGAEAVAGVAAQGVKRLCPARVGTASTSVGEKQRQEQEQQGSPPTESARPPSSSSLATLQSSTPEAAGASGGGGGSGGVHVEADGSSSFIPAAASAAGKGGELVGIGEAAEAADALGEVVAPGGALRASATSGGDRARQWRGGGGRRTSGGWLSEWINVKFAVVGAAAVDAT